MSPVIHSSTPFSVDGRGFTFNMCANCSRAGTLVAVPYFLLLVLCKPLAPSKPSRPSPPSRTAVTSCHDYPLSSSAPNSGCRKTCNNLPKNLGIPLYTSCVLSFCCLFGSNGKTQMLASTQETLDIPNQKSQ